VPPAAAGIGIAALACAALWAAAVLGLGAYQLSRSEDALDRGDAVSAARYARSAAELQPWAAEPYLQLAEVEQGVGNLSGALIDSEKAIENGPDDFRSWFLASRLSLYLGDRDKGLAYAYRSYLLAPELYGRINEFVPEARGGGA
jgi:tetratricopeptide (TPR) repeat protein